MRRVSCIFSVSAAWGTERAFPIGKLWHVEAKGFGCQVARISPSSRCLLSEQERFGQRGKPETPGLLQVRAALCTSHLVGNLVKSD